MAPVRVSVSFEVRPDVAASVEEQFGSQFYPAISAQEGFLECLLLRDATAPSDEGALVGLRLDITFRDESERLAWVNTALHNDRFDTMMNGVLGYQVTNFQIRGGL